MQNLTEVVLKNENLIYSIASKFTKYKDKEDLFQAGCIGLIEAYKHFDETKGVKFTSYAYKYIYGEISKFVREDHNIKLNKDMLTLKHKVEKASDYLSQKLMRSPTYEELESFLEIDHYTLNQILNYNDAFSIDSYFEEMSLYDTLPNKSTDYDSLIYLKNEIEKLEEPERSIMIERYYNDLTQTEIANNLGLSQVEISRKEKKVLTKLRKTFN